MNELVEPKKARITFVVPAKLQLEVRKNLTESGYSLREKSRWIIEAISMLLDLDNFEDLVKIGDELEGFTKNETITADSEIKNQLEIAVSEVRKKYPMLEGVRSRIIRTAILQRLLRT